MFSFARAFSVSALILSAAFCSQAKTLVILDTDFRSDCDDAGALAVLHALADRGECEPVGIIASTTGDHVVAAIDAVNTYYGRPDLAIGLSPKPGKSGGDEFAPSLADRQKFPSKRTNADVLDSTTVYRKLLKEAPNGSISIAVVGSQTCLALLLNSEADHEGDGSIGLTGRELVKAKVKEVAVMGGNFENGDGEWNIMLDVDAANFVMAQWPGPIVYTGSEIGGRILTGGRLASPEKNPVALAYKLSPHTIGGAGKIGARPSWDQTAVYYLVRGTGSPEKPLWNLSEPVSIKFSKRSTEFQPAIPAPEDGLLRRYLITAAPRQEIEKAIEELMLYPAHGGRGGQSE